MCITILSSAHPDYALIVLSNRDEYLDRPTRELSFWDDGLEYSPHILAGQDLARPDHGTWLGISQTGRFASLTNLHEASETTATEAKVSRGAIVRSWLESIDTPEEWARDTLGQDGDDLGSQVGGFNLVFGWLSHAFVPGHDGDESANAGDRDDEGNARTRAPPGLFLFSNRSKQEHGISRIMTPATPASDPAQQTTRALSNATYEDSSWPKTIEAERLLRQLIDDDVLRRNESRNRQGQREGQTRISPTAFETDALIPAFFRLLSTNTFPMPEQGDDLQSLKGKLKDSIFIPILGHEKGVREDQSLSPIHPPLHPYGTQKQTVILVRNDGWVTMIERTLYGDDAVPVPENKQDRRFDFPIQGW